MSKGVRIIYVLALKGKGKTTKGAWVLIKCESGPVPEMR